MLDATYDETLAMTFKNAAGERVMLSLAYGRNQHKGMITHRPEICYPAPGFKLNSSVDDGVVV
ncbi:exosortase C-terminal domain/associated protein EpsI, partial [Roseateles sp. GG27B]